MPILQRAIELWYHDPACTTPVLKLMAELVHNRYEPPAAESWQGFVLLCGCWCPVVFYLLWSIYATKAAKGTGGNLALFQEGRKKSNSSNISRVMTQSDQETRSINIEFVQRLFSRTAL